MTLHDAVKTALIESLQDTMTGAGSDLEVGDLSQDEVFLEVFGGAIDVQQLTSVALAAVEVYTGKPLPRSVA